MLTLQSLDPRPMLTAIWQERLCFLPAITAWSVEYIRIFVYRLTISCRTSLFWIQGVCTEAHVSVHNPALNFMLGPDASVQRLYWYANAVSLVVVSLGVAAYCSLKFIRVIAHYPAATVLAFVSLVTAFAAFDWRVSYHGAQHFVVVQDLLAPHTGAMTPSLASYVAGLVGTVRAITFAAVVPIVALACTALLHPRPGASHEQDIRIHLEALQGALYSSALLLVVAVIEFHSFLHWLAAGHGDQASSSPLNDTITAAVATNGIIYMLFLASIFIPAFLILRRKAQDLARIALPSAPREEQTKWLESLALTPALPRHIINLLAVVSPFLAGLPVARLLDLMK